MNSQLLIEAFGYLGSLLVLVSMLMTSVVKLRIINTIGSIIFTIYACIIKSYPTAFMNFCLVLINLRFLWKMSRMGKEYEIMEGDANDILLRGFLDHYQKDIQKCFPGIVYNLNRIDKTYVVLCQGKPVGFTLGRMDDSDLYLDLDYTIPEFRDFSIAAFLFEHLKKQGIRRLIYQGPVEHHQEYLNRLDFRKTENGYIKEL